METGCRGCLGDTPTTAIHGNSYGVNKNLKYGVPVTKVGTSR